jgi:hypothetical protein
MLVVGYFWLVMLGSEAENQTPASNRACQISYFLRQGIGFGFWTKKSCARRFYLDKGLPEIKLSQFMDSTRLLLPLIPWEFDIF